MVRFLRPGWLITLDSGLWAVDEFHPVAAILDPNSGAVRHVVSWPGLPPAPLSTEWPGPMVVGDGHCLLAQQGSRSALVCVDPDGPRDAVWTDGLRLGAGGFGEVWCLPPPPPQQQQLVSGPHARVPSAAGYHRLLRVRADGQCKYVTVDRAVRALDATPESLVICVDDDPSRVRHLGADTYNVGWTRRYLSIPWGAELPDQISVAESATSDQLPPGIRKQPNMSWYDDSETGGRGLYPVAGVWWQLGRDWRSRSEFEVPFARVLGSAQDASGRIVRRYALGPGMVVSIGAIDGDRALGVAVRRPGGTGLVDVLTLRPGSSEVTTLLAGDAVDITDSCWPLVPRPIEVSS